MTKRDLPERGQEHLWSFTLTVVPPRSIIAGRLGMPGSTEDLAWLLLPRGKEEGHWGRLNSVYVWFVYATMAHKGHEWTIVVPREAALLLAKSSGGNGGE